MPITTSKTELFTSGPISFSSLQSTLGGSPSNIKFSTYLRNDDPDETNPIVPDAIENESIPLISNPQNLGISSFRGMIKQYDLIQSGVDENLDISENRIVDEEICEIVGYTGPWNGNLRRNILKNVNISGTCYASATSNYGVKLEAEAYNLDFNISGEIYGEGGTSSSPNGGGSLYIQNTTTRTSDSTTIDIRLNSNAKVWAGGGAGTSGNPGQSGPLLNCNATSSVNRSLSTGGGGSRDCPGNPCPSGYKKSSCNPTDTRSRCRGTSPRRGESGYVCAGNWSVSCTRNTSFNTQGSGGTGGAGGPGRGYSTLNNSITGTSGNSGTSANCNGGTSTGTSGNSGTSGGEWGEPGGGTSGGQKGIAITGNKYRISGSSTNNLKGGTLKIEQPPISDALVCNIPDEEVIVDDGGENPTPPEDRFETYTVPGTYSWIVPIDVSSISIIAIGGGGGGGGGQSEAFSSDGDSGGSGGGGGGLGYTINTPVTPGDTIWIQVGSGGAGGAHLNAGGSGGSSLVRLTDSSGTLLCAGYGGERGTKYATLGGNGGSFYGDGGGNGGNGAFGSPSREVGGGGGAAGGFNGDGGDGASYTLTPTTGLGGTKGGTAGTNSSNGELGGGGGEGISLDGTINPGGSPDGRSGGNGGAYGGGGGGSSLDTASRSNFITAGNGASGAVRIAY